MEKEKILNIGCGNDTYGTDRIDIIKSNSTTKVCDVEKGLPYEDNHFDEVYSEHVLEHIKNPFNLILEMKRVCKSGGKIIIITDNAGYIFNHIFIKGKIIYHGNYNKVAENSEEFNNFDRHYYLFTIEHLRNLFEFANINTISLEMLVEKKVKTKKSLIIHKILKFIIGKRFSMPCVKITGVKY